MLNLLPEWQGKVDGAVNPAGDRALVSAGKRVEVRCKLTGPPSQKPRSPPLLRAQLLTCFRSMCPRGSRTINFNYRSSRRTNSPTDWMYYDRVANDVGDTHLLELVFWLCHRCRAGGFPV